MIIAPKLKLGYQYIPKVATTSLFGWLYTSCEGKDGASIRGNDNKNAVRHYFKSERHGSLVIENSSSAVDSYAAYYRFAITRDPIKRFLSMYGNRVVHYRDISVWANCADELRAAGLKCDPQINELIDRLDDYLSHARAINHHSRPMMDFLGPDLSVYTRIADIGEVNDVVNDVREFWLKERVDEALERAPDKLGRKQTGGPKLGLEVLSQDSFERLLEFYREDYECIPTVNLRAIKDEFSKSRAMVDAVELIDFSKLELRPELEERRKNLQGDSGASVKRKKFSYRGVSIKREICPLVEYVRFNFPEKEGAVNGEFRLKGAVLLKSEVPLVEGWKLVVNSGSSEKNVDWGLPSPQLADKFLDNPSAVRARFKLDGASFEDDSPLEFFLQAVNGDRHLLATISVEG